MVPWNAPRAKVQIKLSIQRLRTLQEKKLALAKKSRRDIADLVAKGRIETARLRVEGLIQDDIYVELLELLELYAEKLQARFGLLDQASGDNPDPTIEDAVCSIVYAAPRTELKELQVLREILMHKFGRNFALGLLPTEPNPPGVPARVLSKLKTFTPAPALVEAYLSEIANGYGVPYLPALEKKESSDEDLLSPSHEGHEGAGDTDDGAGNGKGVDNEAAEQATGSGSGTPVTVGEGRVSKESSPAKAEEKAEEAAESSRPATVPAPSPGVPPPAYAPRVVKKRTEDDDLAARFDRLKGLR